MKPFCALLLLALGACAAPPRGEEAPPRSSPTGLSLGGTVGGFYSNTASR
jgi:hypothetical protein